MCAVPGTSWQLSHLSRKMANLKANRVRSFWVRIISINHHIYQLITLHILWDVLKSFHKHTERAYFYYTLQFALPEDKYFLVNSLFASLWKTIENALDTPTLACAYTCFIVFFSWSYYSSMVFLDFNWIWLFILNTTC